MSKFIRRTWIYLLFETKAVSIFVFYYLNFRICYVGLVHVYLRARTFSMPALLMFARLVRHVLVWIVRMCDMHNFFYEFLRNLFWMVYYLLLSRRIKKMRIDVKLWLENQKSFRKVVLNPTIWWDSTLMAHIITGAKHDTMKHGEQFQTCDNCVFAYCIEAHHKYAGPPNAIISNDFMFMFFSCAFCSIRFVRLD